MIFIGIFRIVQKPENALKFMGFPEILFFEFNFCGNDIGIFSVFDAMSI